MRTLVPATTSVLLLLMSIGWGVALLRAPLNVDAGLYLSVARDMARGQALYRDLPCDYPPAAFEALSLLGPRWLANPPVVKAVWLFVHAANAALLFGVLRGWRYRRDVAVLAAIVFAAWTMALDGTAIVLEPLVNFFVLLAMLVVGRGPRMTTGFVVGLLVGAALLAKQYALLSLPGVLLLLLFPRAEAEESEPETEDSQRSSSGERTKESRRPGTMQLAIVALLFLAVIPVPAVMYALFNGLDVAEFVSRMATFGDRIGRYEAIGWRGFFVSLTEGGAASALSVYLVIAATLLFVGRRGYHAALACGLMATCGALYVRDYPHYVQLPALWAVLVMVECAVLLTRRFAIKASWTAAVLLILALPLVPRAVATVGATYHTWRDDGAHAQAALAREVAAALPERSDVWIINAPWLYVLADLNAPKGDYRFVDPSVFDERPRGDDREKWLEPAPRFVVLAPGRVPLENAFARLVHAGYRPLATIKGATGTITLFERSSEMGVHLE